MPGSGMEVLCDLACSAEDGWLSYPRAEVMVGADTEDVAFARSAQRLLNVANTVNAIGSDPGERDLGGNRPLDHLHRQRGLGREPRLRWNMCRIQSRAVARPSLGRYSARSMKA